MLVLFAPHTQQSALPNTLTAHVRATSQRLPRSHPALMPALPALPRSVAAPAAPLVSSQQRTRASAMVLLHGVLEVTIHEANNLPNVQLSSHVKSAVSRLCMCCAAAPELIGRVDPYAVMDVGITRRARTRFIKNQPRSVKWEEQFELYLADEAEEFTFEVKVCAYAPRWPCARGVVG